MSRSIFCLIIGVTVAAATAQTASAAPTPNGFSAPIQFPAADVLRPVGGERSVRPIVARIKANTQLLRQAFGAGGVNGRSQRLPDEDDAVYLIDDLMQATDHFSDHLDRNQVFQFDLDDVMRRGAAVESLVDGRGSPKQARSRWVTLKGDLDRLASAYGTRWDWQRPQYSPLESAGRTYRELTGTYQLDPSRSDDPKRAAQQAVRQLSNNRQPQTVRQLQARLDPPDEIAIERIDRRITLASSRGPRMTFEADGRPQVENGFGSGRMTTRATLYGDRLEVVTSGDADEDYTAIFEPLDNGESLRVTKRLVVDTLRQPVVIQSTYRRTSETAGWSRLDDRWDADNGRVDSQRGQASDYRDEVVPDGATLVATLDAPLNGRTVRQNDRVRLTVRDAPSQRLRNAVIEGYVVSAQDNVRDSSGVSIAFTQIRLADGRSADFAGTVESVRGPNGEPISFDGEKVGDRADRDQAVQRGTIGAAVGAVIGAIAGGAKGAAIGAVVGGGGGAATVLLGDQRQLDLPRGTEFTIRSRTPSSR